MTRARQSVVVLVVLSVAALVLLVAFMGDSPLNTRHTLATVLSPGADENAMRAETTTGRAMGGLGPSNTEVEIVGRWQGTDVDDVVMHSDTAQADLLRIGWSSTNAVVISVPQTPEDTGKPLGAGDASYHCGDPKGTIRVVCEAYSIAPQQERHLEAPPPNRSPNH